MLCLKGSLVIQHVGCQIADFPETYYYNDKGDYVAYQEVDNNCGADIDHMNRDKMQYGFWNFSRNSEESGAYAKRHAYRINPSADPPFEGNGRIGDFEYK